MKNKQNKLITKAYTPSELYQILSQRITKLQDNQGLTVEYRSDASISNQGLMILTEQESEGKTVIAYPAHDERGTDAEAAGCQSLTSAIERANSELKGPNKQQEVNRLIIPLAENRGKRGGQGHWLLLVLEKNESGYIMPRFYDSHGGLISFLSHRFFNQAGETAQIKRVLMENKAKVETILAGEFPDNPTLDVQRRNLGVQNPLNTVDCGPHVVNMVLLLLSNGNRELLGKDIAQDRAINANAYQQNIPYSNPNSERNSASEPESEDEGFSPIN